MFGEEYVVFDPLSSTFFKIVLNKPVLNFSSFLVLALEIISPTNGSETDGGSQSNIQKAKSSTGQFLSSLFGNKKKNKESIEAKAKNISKTIIRSLLPSYSRQDG